MSVADNGGLPPLINGPTLIPPPRLTHREPKTEKRSGNIARKSWEQVEKRLRKVEIF